MTETVSDLNPEFDEIAGQMPEVQAMGDQLIADTDNNPEALPFGAEMFQDIPQAIGSLTANETLFSINEELAKEGDKSKSGGGRQGSGSGNGGSNGNGGNGNGGR